MFIPTLYTCTLFGGEMAVTIKDVARQAGVSHPTVSRALRGDPLVAPETAARIKDIASELGYVPSATARSLKTSHSRVVGVIVNRISDAFYSEVLDGIQDTCYANGYSLFLASADNNLEREKALVHAMTERRVDGLIVCSTFASQQYSAQLIAHNTPLVVVHSRGSDRGANAIYHDDRYGSRQMTRHLIDLGHRHIAFVGNARAGRESEERLKGFCEEMQAARLAVPSRYLVNARTGQLTFSVDVVLTLFEDGSRPSGLVCFNDSIAISAMRMLQDAGWRVPEDCSVVGFDNISLSAFVTPPLTTFDQPRYQLGQEAAHMILRLFGGKSRRELNVPPEVITLRGEILVRASTAPPSV